MTVYYEYVLVDNFVIDFMLLKVTLLILGKRINNKRLIIASVIGSLSALLVTLIKIEWILIILKVLVGLLLTAISQTYSSKREYYVTTVVFFCFTFAVGGAIIGVFSLLGLDYSAEISIALMILPVFVVIRGISSVIKFLYRRKDIVSCFFDVVLIINGIMVNGTGFMDTGNGVYYNDKPVIFCEKKLAEKFLSGKGLPKMEYIEINTVSGSVKNLSFNLDEIRLLSNKKENIYKNVMLCVVKGRLGTGYDVLLHPALKGGVNEQVYKENNREVS